MSIEEMEARKAEIRTQLEGDTSQLDVEALTEEVRGINEQLEARRAQAAKEAELRAAVAEGEVGETVKTFVEERNEKTMEINSVEYRNAWAKNLMKQTLNEEERAAVSKAAAVIPTETVNEIYGKMAENPLYAEINKLNIPGYVTIPVVDTVNDASWVGIGTASTDSADVIDSVSLGAKKLIKTLEITADMQSMSIPAFLAWVTDTLAKKMVAAICNAVINGTGTATQPKGLLTGKAAETVTAIDFDAILALMAKVPSQYHNGAVFVTNAATLFGTIYGLQDSNKHPILVSNVGEGGGYLLMGHRVILEEALAGTALMFADLRDGYVLNIAKDVEITADESVAFRTGSTVYRGMALVDGTPVVTDAYATISL